MKRQDVESLFAARESARRGIEIAAAKWAAADSKYCAELNALRLEWGRIPDGYAKASAEQFAQDTAFTDHAFDPNNEAAWILCAIMAHELFPNSAAAE